jgi:hypothetical protein
MFAGVILNIRTVDCSPGSEKKDVRHGISQDCEGVHTAKLIRSYEHQIF